MPALDSAARTRRWTWICHSSVTLMSVLLPSSLAPSLLPSLSLFEIVPCIPDWLLIHCVARTSLHFWCSCLTLPWAGIIGMGSTLDFYTVLGWRRHEDPKSSLSSKSSLARSKWQALWQRKVDSYPEDSTTVDFWPPHVPTHTPVLINAQARMGTRWPRDSNIYF